MSHQEKWKIDKIIITIPRPVFIKYIYTDDQWHTGEHICKIMGGIIEEYGPF